MSDTTATQVEQINPAEAILGPNVRLDARLDKGFLASIKELGVLEPGIGYRDQDDAFVVLRGQRRTLAAVEVGRESIPVIVGASQEDADRIIEQMAENDHRAAMTTRERIAGMATLSGLGMSAAQIAKKTATKRSTVDAALVVATSEVAAAYRRHPCPTSPWSRRPSWPSSRTTRRPRAPWSRRPPTEGSTTPCSACATTGRGRRYASRRPST